MEITKEILSLGLCTKEEYKDFSITNDKEQNEITEYKLFGKLVKLKKDILKNVSQGGEDGLGYCQCVYGCEPTEQKGKVIFTKKEAIQVGCYKEGNCPGYLNGKFQTVKALLKHQLKKTLIKDRVIDSNIEVYEDKITNIKLKEKNTNYGYCKCIYGCNPLEQKGEILITKTKVIQINCLNRTSCEGYSKTGKKYIPYTALIKLKINEKYSEINPISDFLNNPNSNIGIFHTGSGKTFGISLHAIKNIEKNIKTFISYGYSNEKDKNGKEECCSITGLTTIQLDHYKNYINNLNSVKRSKEDERYNKFKSTTVITGSFFNLTPYLTAIDQNSAKNNIQRLLKDREIIIDEIHTFAQHHIWHGKIIEKVIPSGARGTGFWKIDEEDSPEGVYKYCAIPVDCIDEKSIGNRIIFSDNCSKLTNDSLTQALFYNFKHPLHEPYPLDERIYEDTECKEIVYKLTEQAKDYLKQYVITDILSGFITEYIGDRHRYIKNGTKWLTVLLKPHYEVLRSKKLTGTITKLTNKLFGDGNITESNYFPRKIKSIRIIVILKRIQFAKLSNKLVGTSDANRTLIITNKTGENAFKKYQVNELLDESESKSKVINCKIRDDVAYAATFNRGFLTGSNLPQITHLIFHGIIKRQPLAVSIIMEEDTITALQQAIGRITRYIQEDETTHRKTITIMEDVDEKNKEWFKNIISALKNNLQKLVEEEIILEFNYAAIKNNKSNKTSNTNTETDEGIEALKASARALFEQGQTNKEISKRLDKHRHTIREWLKV